MKISVIETEWNWNAWWSGSELLYTSHPVTLGFDFDCIHHGQNGIISGRISIHLDNDAVSLTDMNVNSHCGIWIHVDSIHFDNPHNMFCNRDIEKRACTHVEDMKADCRAWADRERHILPIPDQCSCRQR